MQPDASPIHLVSGGDQNYLPGIKVTVASALAGIHPNRDVVFHILSGGFSEDEMSVLCRIAKRCHARSRLDFHDITCLPVNELAPGPGNSTMCYARIWMESLLPDIGKVIYLDSDTLILGDLGSVWDIPMEGMASMACPDHKVANLDGDAPLSLEHNERSLPYFNSGVLVACLSTWRILKIQSQAVDLMNNPASICRWHDQTALNYVLRGRFRVLPREWNWQSEEVPAKIENPIRILHYTTGSKPWLYWGNSLRFKAWRSCHKTCIGSPLLLFLRNGSWRGLVNGVFDGAVENSRLVRSLYLAHLRLSLRLNSNQKGIAHLEQKIRFLESPRKKRDLSQENHLLKEFRKRLEGRIALAPQP